MKDLKEWVQRAQQGEREAYDRIVRQFQDMAVGYGYSLLRDFHWAEDAAQEAFLQAFLDLPTLRDPLGFPGWFRKIVFKQCDRLTRRKRVFTVSLESAQEVACPAPGPAQLAEEAERKTYINAEIDRLPEKEREVIALFYIGHYSQEAIGGFLELPVTTVKKRLQTARQRLKERMVEMVQDNLKQQAPSRDPRFADQVRAAIDEFHSPNPDHDVSKMPWSRLYAALDEQAAARPGQSVSDRHRAIFNGLLKETQSMLPDDPVLQAIPEARDQEIVEHLRVSVGQGNHATCRGPVLDYPPVRRKAAQLHRDLAKMAQEQPTQLAPDIVVLIFNTLLRAVKQKHADNPTVQAIPEASPEQSIAALELAAAQLQQVMEETEKTMTEAERAQPF
jgi:RNA polymerase sigma factor (sigma-70 family)